MSKLEHGRGDSGLNHRDGICGDNAIGVNGESQMGLSRNVVLSDEERVGISLARRRGLGGLSVGLELGRGVWR